MTRIASRPVSLNLRSNRRPRLALGLAAFGFGLAAGAAPAAAECSAGAMSMSAASGQSYTCTRNCVASAGGRARIIRTEIFSGHGATVSQCLDACTGALGCTAVSYHVSVETRDGIPYTTINCVLIGGGEPSSGDYTDSRPGQYGGLCLRDPPGGLWRDPRIRVDLRILDQDSRRPGVPGPSLPKK